MSLIIPPPDQDVLDRRADIIAAPRRIVPGGGAVIPDPDALRVYECDGLIAGSRSSSPAPPSWRVRPRQVPSLPT